MSSEAAEVGIIQKKEVTFALPIEYDRKLNHLKLFKGISRSEAVVKGLDLFFNELKRGSV